MEKYGYLVATGEQKMLVVQHLRSVVLNFFCHYFVPGLRGFRTSSTHLEMNLVHQAQAIHLSLATKIFVWLSDFQKVFHL
jgi:hypothetical protein